jgi:hypothetical protein
MNIPELEFQHSDSDSPIQAIERATSILRSVGVAPHQIAIWLLRQHSKFDTAHANIYEDAGELVKGLTTQSQPPQTSELPLAASATTFTATQVGQMLVERFKDTVQPLSAQQINQALKQLNFQTCDSKKGWQLTESGQQYGQLIRVTDDLERTRLQVRWLPTVIDRLLPLFNVSF